MKRRDLMEAILAAHAAVKDIQENWETGDLAGAVRHLALIDKAFLIPAIEWWEKNGTVEWWESDE